MSCKLFQLYLLTLVQATLTLVFYAAHQICLDLLQTIQEPPRQQQQKQQQREQERQQITKEETMKTKKEGQQQQERQQHQRQQHLRQTTQRLVKMKQVCCNELTLARVLTKRRKDKKH